MFTQIQTEMDILSADIENEIEYTTQVRKLETNPNVFNEHSGRMIGLTIALQEVKNTKALISDHITEILKNTIDGNYVAKLGILEDENRVLRDKVYMLEKDLAKQSMFKNKTDNLPENIKEEREKEEQQNKEDDNYEQYGE